MRDREQITRDLAFDFVRDRDRALFIRERREQLDYLRQKDSVIREQEIEQNQHRKGADQKLRRLRHEAVCERMLLHFDGLGLRLRRAGRCGRGEIFDRSAGLRDVLHRALQRHQFLLELMQAVRGLLQPAGGGCGEERNGVAERADERE